MNAELVSFSSQEGLELFHGTFMVPVDWKSCGVVIYISGAAGIGNSQPVALALTKDSVSLCERDGPRLSISILSIKEVKVVDLTGISFSVNTPSGIVEMAPPRAKGIAITYLLNPLGTQMELSLYTFTPKSAYKWVNTILEAINFKSAGLGETGKISHQ